MGNNTGRLPPPPGLLLVALLLGLAGGTAAPEGAQDYRQASITPPGNLAPGEMPQFLLVTFDDGITSFAESFIQPVIGGLRNPDGSSAPVTYFVTKVNTDPALARQRYLAGNEIANHTATHTTGNETTDDQWLRELRETNRFFVNKVGIPSSQIAGFRAPNLQTNSGLWRALQAESFTYDASLEELITVPPKVSTGVDAYVWPYTLDDGARTACTSSNCPGAPVPGLWSIPLWVFYDEAGRNIGSLDPAVGFDAAYSQALEHMFAARYSGNRCPLGLYNHAGQLAFTGRQEVLRAFLVEKLKLPDVWMITMRGLIEWMRNPVPVSGLSQWFAAGGHRGAGKPEARAPGASLAVGPGDGAAFPHGEAELEWEVLLTASGYRLQLSGDPGFTRLLVDTTGLARTVFALSGSLPGGRYYWRVRGENSRGAGAWSDSRSLVLGTVNAVADRQGGIPARAVLEQNYPNPFNPRTVITFRLPASSLIRLAVYDLLGREVAVLADGLFGAGSHQAVWDAASMPSGNYICRLEGPAAVPARTLMVVK
jgi:hypothetical protein